MYKPKICIFHLYSLPLLVRLSGEIIYHLHAKTALAIDKTPTVTVRQIVTFLTMRMTFMIHFCGDVNRFYDPAQQMDPSRIATLSPLRQNGTFSFRHVSQAIIFAKRKGTSSFLDAGV